MKRRSCLALTALLTALPPAQATPAGPGLFGFTENLPPLKYLDASGPQGFSVELLRLMADTAGLPLALEVLPWQRALQQAESQAGSVLFSLTRTPEREAQFQWVGPIAPRRVLLYKLASRTELRLNRLDELGTARIGVVRDSAADRYLQSLGLKPGLQLEPALDDATNVRKLLAGRMEFAALLDWAATWNLRQLRRPEDALQPVLELEASRAYWFGLRSDADPGLVKRLQAALDTLKRDGRYDKLRQRYLR